VLTSRRRWPRRLICPVESASSRLHALKLTFGSGHYGNDLADSDSDDDRKMAGYADSRPNEQLSYRAPPPPRTEGGVAYASIGGASFTPNAQWGYDAPMNNPEPISYRTENYSGQPPGGYRYDEVRHYSYSARPQFNPEPPQPTVPQPDPRHPSRSNSFPAALPYPEADHAFPPPPPGAYPVGGPGLPGLPPPPSGLAAARGATIREVAPPSSSGLRPQRSSTAGPGLDIRSPSPRLGLDRLSVSGSRPDINAIVGGGGGGGSGLPPPSPLLEAYKGTWQTMATMPSPMVRPYDDEDLDDLPPLSPRVSRTSVNIRERAESFTRRSPERRVSLREASPERRVSRREASPERVSVTTKNKKKVSMYAGGAAEEDAKDIAEELSRSNPDVKILIDILPTLSHDQILELRASYKHVAKVQGRGINLAKHIKLKTAGNFQKICYVTALGRWESEGYWANYWYQSNSARRELLIEALMGRSNGEIRSIKDSFKDSRYNHSLTRCMDKELKADKFRSAVLMALEERRQDESDVWPTEYKNRDADTLYEALRRRDGGESAILQIVVTRSNAHLRDVLKIYERKYEGNFAKDALKKSNNLVVSYPLRSGASSTGALTCHLGRGHRSYFERHYQ